MAARVSSSARRTTNRRVANTSQMYVYGSAVPQREYEPQRHQPVRKKKQHTSSRVMKNRRQAMQMNRAYVVFLAVAAVIALLVCVHYIQLRSELTSRSKNISVLQERLASISEENTTKYNVIMDTVNLDEIRTKAMDDLGMVYANETQIIQYDNPTGDYIKQYEEIPDEGVLASSLDTEE